MEPSDEATQSSQARNPGLLHVVCNDGFYNLKITRHPLLALTAQPLH